MQKEVSKKMAEKIAQKERLTNIFLVEFVIAIVYCILVFVHLALWTRATDTNIKLAHGITFIMPWVTLAITAVLIALPFIFKNIKRSDLWNTITYFFAGIAVGGWALRLFIALGKFTDKPGLGWLAKIKAGNELTGIKGMYALIGLALTVCFIKYLIDYNKIGKNKKSR